MRDDVTAMNIIRYIESENLLPTIKSTITTKFEPNLWCMWKCSSKMWRKWL